MPESPSSDLDVQQILDTVQDAVYRLCLMQLGRRDLALEASQETALRVIRDYRRFEGKSSITTWALGIALNVCRELRRKETYARTQVPLTELANSDPSTPIFDSNEPIEQLKMAMEQLTQRQRETVTLRFLEQRSVKETADLLEIAEGTVKATTSQALRLLRRLIGKNIETE